MRSLSGTLQSRLLLQIDEAFFPRKEIASLNAAPAQACASCNGKRFKFTCVSASRHKHCIHSAKPKHIRPRQHLRRRKTANRRFSIENAEEMSYAYHHVLESFACKLLLPPYPCGAVCRYAPFVFLHPVVEIRISRPGQARRLHSNARENCHK